MRFTTFPNHAGAIKSDHDEEWAALQAVLADPPTYPSKAACPWLKLGAYGDARTPNGSLRHNANLLCVTGLEGDYDGERVSIEEAAGLARAAGLSAFLYTSPSHRSEAPRWRVLAPLSREYPPEARDAFMNRLIGVFGGILSSESFNRSQAFLWGRVAGVEYRTIHVP
jgi:hypothetical protein